MTMWAHLIPLSLLQGQEAPPQPEQPPIVNSATGGLGQAPRYSRFWRLLRDEFYESPRDELKAVSKAIKAVKRAGTAEIKPQLPTRPAAVLAPPAPDFERERVLAALMQRAYQLRREIEDEEELLLLL